MANEDDVVFAFRQAVEEEMERAQSNGEQHNEVLQSGASTEENLRRLAARHQELEREVKLLRTIILKLISDPVDELQ